MGYKIVVASAAIVLFLLLLQFEPTVGKQIFAWHGDVHAKPRVGAPPTFAAAIAGLAVSLIAAFIGIRVVKLYGGAVGDALTWLIAGFIFIAGIIIMELPSQAGLTKFELVQNSTAHAMQLLGMISVVIGLRKLIKATK